ncbi:MAG: sulfur oxidation c-type cytochrome SoxA [Steroidobacteraceae bacterium]
MTKGTGLSMFVEVATLAWEVGIIAQQPAADPLAQYREMMGTDNSAELWETRGESLWNSPRGPKNAALTRCDLGLGPGVVKTVYARLPRYFPDTGKVQDLESRLVTCMTRIQGFDAAELIKNRFGDGESHKSDLEALTAFVVAQSHGEKMAMPFDTPQERAAYALGKQIFYYRAGTHDFSCATCHSQDDKRVRLQGVANLTTAKGAQAAYSTWPAYRESQGELRTMEWRLDDCFRQQRLPDLIYGSEVAVALTAYLAKNAEGAPLAAPGIKR